MTDLTTFPQEDNYESQIVGELTQAQTTPFSLEVKKAPQFTLSSGTVDYIVDSGTSKAERLRITGINGTTLTVGTRGLPAFKGGASQNFSHGGGAAIIMSNPFSVFDDIATAVNSKAGVDENNTWTGTNTFEDTVTVDAPLDVTGTSSYVKWPNMTTAQRLALTPSNGFKVYDTDDNLDYTYRAGAWATIDTGTTTPNASETVAGIGELPTQVENDAGTVTGGSGGPLISTPQRNAASVQNGSWVYAESTSGNDTYAATIVPAVTAYATGLRVRIKVDTANIGACTLDLNSVGAGAIKNTAGNDPENGDIPADGIIDVIYDGTNWVLQTPTANAVATQTYVDDNTNITTGISTFSVTSGASTQVIAHGLGRTPRLVTINWGTTTSVNTFNSLGEGYLYYDGSTLHAINRRTLSAGNAAWSNGFNVNGDNNTTIDWIGDVAIDGTNITLSVIVYNTNRAIQFTWKAE